MERYNKVYLALWLLFFAITLAVMTAFVLNSLAGMIEVDEMLENEGLALSFLLLVFASIAIGAILATSAIDRIPWAYQTHAFFTSRARGRVTNMNGGIVLLVRAN
jgi:hypothetical protein